MMMMLQEETEHMPSKTLMIEPAFIVLGFRCFWRQPLQICKTPSPQQTPKKCIFIPLWIVSRWGQSSSRAVRAFPLWLGCCADVWSLGVVPLREGRDGPLSIISDVWAE